ncbi:MAG TPA: hypothetical protein PLE74_07680 [Candidatus Cloacimonadota bacterium]|nr:hypothetical protein [Candidatus Cloacimonadota bacterium]
METYTKYIVTGITVCGSRFKLSYGSNESKWAFSINLHKGSVWGQLPNGKRKLLKRVSN